MPRLARLDALGVLHHVIIRGIERRNVFEDNRDRDNLLKRLGELSPAAKTPLNRKIWIMSRSRKVEHSGNTTYPSSRPG